MNKNKEEFNETIEETTIDMDLEFDDDIGFSNAPKKDKEGYVRGKLVKIEKKERIDEKKRTTNDLQEDLTVKYFKFCFLMEGAVENINMSRLTGTNLRPEKVHIKAKGRGKDKEQGEYNSFTEMCLRLGIINEKELEERNKSILVNITKAIKTISNENPIYIKAKLEQNEKDDNSFETIKIKSIQLIDKF